jgi:nucleotide-binding universal stress UspA family protein
MTRVIFATDLSEASGVAERLIRSIAWPVGTSVTVVTVVPPQAELFGTAWAPMTPVRDVAAEAAHVRTARLCIQSVVGRLATRGIEGTAVVMRGPAADAIVELADRERADLIIVGSRGHGAIEGAILGSVSEAVADRANCPVLIARTDRIRRSVIADDGSAGAQIAIDYVRTRRHLLGDQTRIVDVANASDLWMDTITPPLDAGAVQVLADDERARQADARVVVEASARELRNVGQPVETRFVEGPAGPTLVDETLAWHGDLVVVGSHLRTGLQRMVFGSVGRFVLHHAHCSVLQVGRVASTASQDVREPLAAAR